MESDSKTAQDVTILRALIRRLNELSRSELENCFNEKWNRRL